MQGALTFKYSTDNAASWSSVITLNAAMCHAFPTPEIRSDESGEQITDHELYQNVVARLLVEMTFEVNQFSPSVAPTTWEALWIATNKLRCAPLVHMHYTGTSIDGYTHFAASTNTNYLLVEDAPDPRFDAANPNDIRELKMTLKMAKEYAI